MDAGARGVAPAPGRDQGDPAVLEANVGCETPCGTFAAKGTIGQSSMSRSKAKQSDQKQRS